MTFTPKPFQTVPPPITAADVPLSTLAADMQQLVARQRACQAPRRGGRAQPLAVGPDRLPP
ncbi:hypothetical protein [Streptomyces sp. LN245]|uniref:hypothetical protein n=1 Tax=Streptomyces sp. LN245 TaxID=3112975 RepID=UPI00370F8545